MARVKKMTVHGYGLYEGTRFNVRVTLYKLHFNIVGISLTGNLSTYAPYRKGEIINGERILITTRPAVSSNIAIAETDYQKFLAL